MRLELFAVDFQRIFIVESLVNIKSLLKLSLYNNVLFIFYISLKIRNVKHHCLFTGNLSTYFKKGCSNSN